MFILVRTPRQPDVNLPFYQVAARLAGAPELCLSQSINSAFLFIVFFFRAVQYKFKNIGLKINKTPRSLAQPLLRMAFELYIL